MLVRSASRTSCYRLLILRYSKLTVLLEVVCTDPGTTEEFLHYENFFKKSLFSARCFLLGMFSLETVLERPGAWSASAWVCQADGPDSARCPAQIQTSYAYAEQELKSCNLPLPRAELGCSCKSENF